MKKRMLGLLFLLLLTVGFALGITVNILTPHFMGFYSEIDSDTELRIISMQHVIISPTKVRTTIRIQNPSFSTISFNTTVTFFDSGEIFNYTISDTLNSGVSRTYTNTNNFNVTVWHSTTIHIDGTS